ncbi:GxxExxY protein [Patescibacteria group bacterium]|nr:GxxExxY protein [Patescibacteria group bacterium]
MYTNYTKNTNKVLFPDLSYKITGICFDVHNNLGKYAKEKQYCDEIEKRLIEAGLKYKREFDVPGTGNRIDFLIEDKIIIEAKAKRIITREDYYQTQRYLQSLNIRLGILINFRNQYIKPTRIIKIDTDIRKKFTEANSYN